MRKIDFYVSCVPYFCTVLGWTILFTSTNSFLLTLGMNESLVGLSWLAGPASGLIVQPIIGYFLDRTKKRKIYVLIGWIMTSICLYFYSTPNVLICCLSFFGTCFTLNLITVTIQTYTSDVVIEEEQNSVQLLGSFFGGIGNMVGFILGSIEFSKSYETQIRIVFNISNGIFSIMMFLSVLGIRDLKNKVKEKDEERKEKKIIKKKEIRSWVKLIKDLPKEFWSFYFIQFFIYLGKYLINVYATDYTAKQIFEGHPIYAKDEYLNGVRFCNSAFIVHSLITIACAPILAYLSKRFGVGKCWVFANIIEFISLTLLIFNKNKWIAAIIFAAIGIIDPAIKFPWIFVNRIIKRGFQNESAIIGSLFNSSQCIPQIVGAFVTSYLFNFIEINNWNVGVIFSLGSISSVISMCLLTNYLMKNNLKKLKKN